MTTLGWVSKRMVLSACLLLTSTVVRPTGAKLQRCSESWRCVNDCGQFCHQEWLGDEVPDAELSKIAKELDACHAPDRPANTPCKPPTPKGATYASCLRECHAWVVERELYPPPCWEHTLTECGLTDRKFPRELYDLADECRYQLQIQRRCLALDEELAYDVMLLEPKIVFSRDDAPDREADLASGDAMKRMRYAGTRERRHLAATLKDRDSDDAKRLVLMQDFLREVCAPGRLCRSVYGMRREYADFLDKYNALPYAFPAAAADPPPKSPGASSSSSSSSSQEIPSGQRRAAPAANAAGQAAASRAASKGTPSS